MKDVSVQRSTKYIRGKGTNGERSRSTCQRRGEEEKGNQESRSEERKKEKEKK